MSPTCAVRWRARTLASSWVEDRVVAALRLGEYEEAARLAASRESLEPRLVALVRRGAAVAAEVPLDARSPAALEGRALAECVAGELQSALLLVELAVLRGREGLERVRVALQETLVAPGAARATWEGLPRAWSDALAARGGGGEGTSR